MKRKLVFLILIMAVVSLLSWGIVKGFGTSHDISDQRLQIVTSFYPMYVLTQNLTIGVDKVEVVSMTESSTGCLHDYQLTTKDMRTLSDAELLIVNGGGAENFIDEILESCQGLTVIDSSEGVQLLEESGQHVHEGEVPYEHGEENGHIWMDVDRYIMQIENVCKGLCLADPSNGENYQENCEKYIQRVAALKENYSGLESLRGEKIIIFHDAFAYLADALGMEVVHAVELDSESSLSAGEVADIIDEIRLHNIRYVFTEEQYMDSIASSIAGETSAAVYVMDSLVTGDGGIDSYIKGMERNFGLLKELADD